LTPSLSLPSLHDALPILTSAAAPALPVHRSTQLAAGMVSGTTGTAAGIGGPPIALLYQHRAGPVVRSTLSATFLVGTVLSFTVLDRKSTRLNSSHVKISY